MKYKLLVLSTLILSGAIEANTTKPNKLNVKLAPSPALVKQCKLKTMTNPLRDYEARYVPGKNYPDGRVATKPHFECKISKKYTKPYCRKAYKLVNNRCSKLLGAIKLN